MTNRDTPLPPEPLAELLRLKCIETAITHLKFARESARRAPAPDLHRYLSRCLKSAEGAAAHAEHRYRAVQEGRPKRRRRSS